MLSVVNLLSCMCWILLIQTSFECLNFKSLFCVMGLLFCVMVIVFFYSDGVWIVMGLFLFWVMVCWFVQFQCVFAHSLMSKVIKYLFCVMGLFWSLWLSCMSWILLIQTSFERLNFEISVLCDGCVLFFLVMLWIVKAEEVVLLLVFVCCYLLYAMVGIFA